MKRSLWLFAVLGLCACGGGGGGGAAPAAPASTLTTAPTLSAAMQRTLVQQTLSSTTEAQQVATYGTTSSTLGHLRRALAGERTQQVACSGGLATTITAGSASNVENITLDAYYDAGCTALWYVGVGTITATSSTAGTANIAYTYYTTAGAVYRYATATLTLSGIGTGSGSFSLAAAIATAPGAAPFTNVGLACTIAATADGCSAAEADHLGAIGTDVGVALALNAGFGSAANGGVVVSASGNAAANTGSLNTISVVPQGAGFTISGGTAIDAASVTVSLTMSSAGIVTAGTLGLADARDGAAVNAAYNPSSQTIAGSVILSATGATVATFSVSVAGSGTIAYADGSSGTISNWVVSS